MIGIENNNIETPDEQKEPGVVSLRHYVLRRVNFASAQNDVAIIEGITVENPTDEALTDMKDHPSGCPSHHPREDLDDRPCRAGVPSLGTRHLYPARHRTDGRPRRSRDRRARNPDGGAGS